MLELSWEAGLFQTCGYDQTPENFTFSSLQIYI